MNIISIRSPNTYVLKPKDTPQILYTAVDEQDGALEKLF